MEKLIIEIIRILLIFSFGSLLGWILEYFYRGMKLNPGFLSGPYLPIYGVAAVLLNYISGLEMDFISKILVFAFYTTILEFITGIIFIYYYKLKLWDYSKHRFNFKGIVCPLYTFYWTILSIFFYYLIYPFITRIVRGFYANLELSFFIGIFYGIFIVDLWQSFKLASRVKNFMDKNRLRATISLDVLKAKFVSRLNQQGHKNILIKFFSSPNRLLNNELFSQLSIFLKNRRH